MAKSKKKTTKSKSKKKTTSKARGKTTAKRSAKKKAGKKKSARRSTSTKAKFKIGDRVLSDGGWTGEVVDVGEYDPGSRTRPYRIRRDLDKVYLWQMEHLFKKDNRKVASKPGQTGDVISAKPTNVDFDDEQAVLREVAMTLGEDDILDQLDIEETSHMFTGVKAYRITTGGLHGREWCVMLNDEEAYDEAVARVKQDLEESPEMFPAWLIESHINMDRLKKWVRDANMEDPYAEEIAKDDPDRFWEEFERRGLSVDEYETTDEDGETVLPEDVPQSAIETFREDQANDWADKPMEYLEQFESAEDARKRAIDIAGIDEDEVADEVVRGDGWANTLATYDGDYQQTPSKFVVFRTN